MVLLHGIKKTHKKTQQTPEGKLDLAVKRQKEVEVARHRNRHPGSSFDEFLRSEGLYEEVTTLAWKRVLSWEVTQAMKKGGISKSEVAKRMGTSRSQLERVLDPENPNVLLDTVQKAATAVGKRLMIGLTDAPRAA
jgi:predicted XRE-type DNA-binding protein